MRVVRRDQCLRCEEVCEFSHSLRRLFVQFGPSMGSAASLVRVEMFEGCSRRDREVAFAHSQSGETSPST